MTITINNSVHFLPVLKINWFQFCIADETDRIWNFPVMTWTNFGPSQGISPKYHADIEVCARHLHIFKTAIPSMQQSKGKEHHFSSLLNWK